MLKLELPETAPESLVSWNSLASIGCSEQSLKLTLNFMSEGTSKVGTCMFGPIACMEGAGCMYSWKIRSGSELASLWQAACKPG